jgi:hypothetical protein
MEYQCKWNIMSEEKKQNHRGQILGSTLAGVGSFFIGKYLTKSYNLLVSLHPNLAGNLSQEATNIVDELKAVTVSDINFRKEASKAVDFNQDRVYHIFTDLKNLANSEGGDLKQTIDLSLEKLKYINNKQFGLLCVTALAAAAGTAYMLRPKNEVHNSEYEGTLESRHLQVKK